MTKLVFKYWVFNPKTKETYLSGEIQEENIADDMPGLTNQVVKILNEVSESD